MGLTGKVDPEFVGHGATSIGMFVIFATNLCVFGCLEIAIRSNTQMSRLVQKESDLEVRGGKRRAKALAPTLISIRGLCCEVARLGFVLGLAWVCEYHPPFKHSSKHWDRDLYCFLCLLLLVYSLQDARPVKSADVLGREQTEEWKGWMQFMFLLYHYYKAEEVYNSIRVMITCYVWMTGFGNFSFFYIKRDFGAVRVLQMLWRLNFLVTLLCLVMGNTYILYYICPLHTFFFFMVYGTMRVLPRLNHDKWGIRLKLMAVAGLVFVVWDLGPGHCGFAPSFAALLSRDPTIGATGGTAWEWYFRTSLDHWSTLLGMVFALNYPMMTLWFKKVEALSPSSSLSSSSLPSSGSLVRRGVLVKTASALLVGSLGVWWGSAVLPLPKPEYNLSNPYFGWVPLLVFVFFRNLTPGLRRVYLHPLHNIGKTTLETYLMQHHVWLTSNAKTLLTVVPGGYPLLNALVATILFVSISQELYRLTMSLRGMLMPDDNLSACVKGLVVLGAVAAAASAVGAALLASSLLPQAPSLSPLSLIPPPPKSTASTTLLWPSAGPLALALVVLCCAWCVLKVIESAIASSTSSSSAALTAASSTEAFSPPLDATPSSHSESAPSSSSSSSSFDGGAQRTDGRRTTSPASSSGKRFNDDEEEASHRASNSSSSRDHNAIGDAPTATTAGEAASATSASTPAGSSSSSSSSSGGGGGGSSNERRWRVEAEKEVVRRARSYLGAAGVLLLATLEGSAWYLAHHPTKNANRGPLPLTVLSRPMPPPTSASESFSTISRQHPASSSSASSLPLASPRELGRPTSSSARGGMVPELGGCLEAANRGHWSPSPDTGNSDDDNGTVNHADDDRQSAAAVSRLLEWVWDEVSDGSGVGVSQCRGLVGGGGGGSGGGGGEAVEREPSERRQRGGARVGVGEAQALLRNKRVVVIGDSVARFTYYALARALGDAPGNAHNATSPKHADISLALPPRLGGASLSFLWAPFAVNVTARLSELSRTAASTTATATSSTLASLPPPDVVVLGCGLWDALWTRDPHLFRTTLGDNLDRLTRTLKSTPQRPTTTTTSSSSSSDSSTVKGEGRGDEWLPPLIVWLDSTAVVDSHLESPLKRQFMTDAVVARHYSARDALAFGGRTHRQQEAQHAVGPAPPPPAVGGVDAVIRGREVTQDRGLDSTDGVHYADHVYDVFAQILLNMAHSAAASSTSSSTARTFRAPPPPAAASAESPLLTTTTAAPPPQQPHQSPPWREVCEMGRPWPALGVAVCVAVMLFGMDNFLGLPTLAAWVLGGRDLNAQLSWEAAYVPLHQSIGVTKGG